MDGLLFFTENYSGSRSLRRFTAPSGFLYALESVTIANYGVGSTQFQMIDRYVEEDIEFISRDTSTFLTLHTLIAGHIEQVIFPTPLKMKHISMGVATAANISLVVTVFYQLVKASLPELVYEFISRGKSP